MQKQVVSQTTVRAQTRSRLGTSEVRWRHSLRKNALQELVVRGEQDVFLTLSCQQYKLIEDLFTAELLACKDMLPSWHRRVLWWYNLRGGLSQCSVHVG
jgi:hypothetical protein